MNDGWLALYVAIIKKVTVIQAFRAIGIRGMTEEKRIELKKKYINKK